MPPAIKGKRQKKALLSWAIKTQRQMQLQTVQRKNPPVLDPNKRKRRQQQPLVCQFISPRFAALQEVV
jgi:hypothetical protein